MCTTDNLVYLAGCRDCGVIYVGETGNTLKARWNLHAAQPGDRKKLQSLHKKTRWTKTTSQELVSGLGPLCWDRTPKTLCCSCIASPESWDDWPAAEEMRDGLDQLLQKEGRLWKPFAQQLKQQNVGSSMLKNSALLGQW
jgi:hypothetical protein